MPRELRHGAGPPIFTVIAVLLGLFLMHGLSGSLSGAAVHHAAVGGDASPMRGMTTTATSSMALERTAGGTALSAVGELHPVGQVEALAAWTDGQAGGEERSVWNLMGLCLGLLTIILVVLVAAHLRPWVVPGAGPWRVLIRPLPVRCRAPDLFALGVLRC